VATAGGSRGPGAERAYASPLPAHGEVVLSPDESAHLVRVRRAEAGDEVVLFDGEGATRRARLVTADARAARLTVLADAPDREPTLALVVAASPPETARADLLVEQLAWLGVARWIPLLCARTPGERGAAVLRRRERFERLAREAAKGNGRSRVLEVADPVTLDALLARPPAPRLVVLDPDPAAPRLVDLAASGHGSLCCLIGPEGGFTETELQACLTAGARVAALSACVLRVEQAAVTAAAQALGRA
jgi:16S rRNA (uracil1498-N3)-methyltransferase